MTLTALLSLAGLLTENVGCILQDPQVEVSPSEVYIGQQAVVDAKISVKLC